MIERRDYFPPYSYDWQTRTVTYGDDVTIRLTEEQIAEEKLLLLIELEVRESERKCPSEARHQRASYWRGRREGYILSLHP